PEQEPFPPIKVKGWGYSEVTLSVAVHSVLKLQFVPGTQDENQKDTGFFPHYSGLGVYIRVENTEHSTPLLYNGTSGGEAQKSKIFDFSNAFQKECPKSIPECRQTVTIKVYRPNYDYYCFNSTYFPLECNYLLSYGVRHHNVLKDHAWNGWLYIETD